MDSKVDRQSAWLSQYDEYDHCFFTSLGRRSTYKSVSFLKSLRPFAMWTALYRTLICNIKRRDSTKQMFKQLNILRMPQIRDHTIGLFMYKYRNNLLPDIFNDFFETNKDTHEYNTRNASQLRTPLVKNDLANRFISKTGVLYWNKIEAHIKTDTKISSFKNT